MPMNFDLQNDAFRRALELVVKDGRHLLLTGRAGTGKNTFVYALPQLTEKRLLVMAPTAETAAQSGFPWLETVFGLPIPAAAPGRNLSAHPIPDLKNRLQAVDLLVIVAADQLRAPALDAVDRLLRAATGKARLPFGGKQLVCIAETTRLLAARSPGHAPDRLLFVHAASWRAAHAAQVELRKVYPTARAATTPAPPARATLDQFGQYLDRDNIAAALQFLWQAEGEHRQAFQQPRSRLLSALTRLQSKLLQLVQDLADARAAQKVLETERNRYHALVGRKSGEVIRAEKRHQEEIDRLKAEQQQALDDLQRQLEQKENRVLELQRRFQQLRLRRPVDGRPVDG